MSRGMALGNNFIGEYLPMIAKKKKGNIVSIQQREGQNPKSSNSTFPLLDGPRYKCSKDFSPPENNSKKCDPLKNKGLTLALQIT